MQANIQLFAEVFDYQDLTEVVTEKDKINGLGVCLEN